MKNPETIITDTGNGTYRISILGGWVEVTTANGDLTVIDTSIEDRALLTKALDAFELKYTFVPLSANDLVNISRALNRERRSNAITMDSGVFEKSKNLSRKIDQYILLHNARQCARKEREMNGYYPATSAIISDNRARRRHFEEEDAAKRERELVRIENHIHDDYTEYPFVFCARIMAGVESAAYENAVRAEAKRILSDSPIF